MRAYLAALAIVLWAGVALAAGPVADTAGGFINGSGNLVSTLTVPITTTQTDDIVILTIDAQVTGASAIGTAPGTPPHDVAGLTWTRRGQKQSTFPSSVCSGGCSSNVEVWWAYSHNALSADTITVTLTGSAVLTLRTWGMHGAVSFTAPWDTNPSLPAYAANTTGGNVAVQIPSISTDETNDAVIGMLGEVGNNSVVGTAAVCIGSTGQTGAVGTVQNCFTASSSCPGPYDGDDSQVLLALPKLTGATAYSQANGACTNSPPAIQEWLFLVDALAGSTLGCVAPALDTSVIGGVQSGNSSFAMPSLTTAHPNELLYLFIGTVANNSHGATPPAITGISDTAALTWAHRGSRQNYSSSFGNAGQIATDFYWAWAPGALSGDTVSINWADGVNSVMILTTYAGVASSVAPFDSNVSLPAVGSDLSGTAGPPKVLMSTTNPADTIVTTCMSFVYGGSGQCGSSTGTFNGFTNITESFCSVFGNVCSSDAFYRQTLTTLSNVYAYADNGTGTEQAWTITADALAGASSTCVAARPQVWINE